MDNKLIPLRPQRISKNYLINCFEGVLKINCVTQLISESTYKIVKRLSSEMKFHTDTELLFKLQADIGADIADAFSLDSAEMLYFDKHELGATVCRKVGGFHS